MREKIINFETAKLAKKKGLNKVWCNNMYCIGFKDFPDDEEIIECDWRNHVDHQYHLALAPTQSLLQKWLREKHNLHVSVEFEFTKKLSWRVNICDTHKFEWLLPDFLNAHEFDTYEEALEEGLQEALKIIDNKN